MRVIHINFKRCAKNAGKCSPNFKREISKML